MSHSHTPRDSDRRRPPQSYQNSPTRRPRPNDVEATRYYDDPPSPRASRRPRQQASFAPAPPPHTTPVDRGNMSSSAAELGRKKSLIRPERNRIDRDHPNYHYRQHAQNMTVYPSTTGNDPILENEDEVTLSSEETELKEYARKETRRHAHDPASGDRQRLKDTPMVAADSKRMKRKLTKKEAKALNEEEKLRQKQEAALRPPSLWNVYCSIITFWAPSAVLACFGMPSKAQQRAWKEKIGLISIILVVCAFVGFLTFGFTQAVCGTPTLRVKSNGVGKDSMIFHGKAYNLNGMRHPAAEGIPDQKNPIYDLPHKYGGQDGSFMFQNVNGACKGLITPAAKSDVPTDNNGGLAWYFPCVAFDQDGSSKPNTTVEYRIDYACHLTGPARSAFYDPGILGSTGEVFFTWDNIKNTSRNLTVFSGSVIDLNILDWFNLTQVKPDPLLMDIRNNPAVRGVDITHAYRAGIQKQVGQCLTEIAKVGSIDTDTIGCIASQVVLYVSLVFILAIVVSKFVLAVFFQWFWSRRYAAAKSTLGGDSKKRKKEIEAWSDDIYRAPPKLGGDVTPGKRGSLFLPTKSRFTSPYASERSGNRPTPTTMASQNSAAKLLPPPALFSHGDGSDGSFNAPNRFSTAGSRSSLQVGGLDNRQSALLDANGLPHGFIH